MEFEFIYDPVELVIIRNVFTDKENSEILAEAIDKESTFDTSVVGSHNSTSTKFRNNLSSFYDNIYIKDRSQSKLLSSIDNILNDEKIYEVLSSFTYPINLFGSTNHHETQVSRYGDEGQDYKYHIDYNGMKRTITFVYYFNKEPKEYTGGEIQFTRSPTSNGSVLDKNEIPITIKPENNMMIVFGSKVSHTVLPTTSPKSFDSGRFSANIWIGTH